MTPDDQINSVEIAVASRGAADPSLSLTRRTPVRVVLRWLPLCGALIYIGAALLPWFTVSENFGALAHTTTHRAAWTYWSGVTGVSAAVVVVIVWLALLAAPHIATRVLLPAQVTFALFGALALAGLVGFEAHNLIGLGPQLPGVSYQIGVSAFAAAGGALLIIVFGMFASWPSLAMYPTPLGIDARALPGAPSQPLYLPAGSVYSQPLPYAPTPSQPISYGGQPTFPPGYMAPPSQPLYGAPPSQPISYGGQPSQPLYGAPPAQPLYGPPAPYGPGGPAPTPTGPQPAMPPYSSPPSQPISYGGQPSQPLYGTPPAQPYQYPAAPWQPPAEKPPARSLPSPFGPPAPRDAGPGMPRQSDDYNPSNPAEDGATDTPNEDAPA